MCKCVQQAKCTSKSEQESFTGRRTHVWCRLAAQAQHEDQTSWLYQASSLTLTEAGQKALLLHAGLPQQLIHQLYRLPTDHDTDAMREQQHAKLLHACEVNIVSWQGGVWMIISLFHFTCMVDSMLIIYLQAKAMPMCFCLSVYEYPDQMQALQALRKLFYMETVSLVCKHCSVGAQTNERVMCSCIAHTRVHQTSHLQPAPAEP